MSDPSTTTIPLPPSETVSDDDLCPICHLLLFSPVRTHCSHTLCASCMAQWASTSSLTNIIHSSTDISLRHFDATYDAAYDLTASCPMCRTYTSAAPDPTLALTLSQKYPATYSSRQVEEDIARGLRAAANGVEGIMILIGNRHRLENSAGGRQDEMMNQHDWTFFTRFSRTDIIKEVRVNLHPTFRPPRVTLHAPPFEVRRLGWGVFVIRATMRRRVRRMRRRGDLEGALDEGDA
ncbi:hypothetical protein DM02DRAFT_311846 [Periconia macrospinosa]|uniref:Protein AF-9 homolog n=1 Tax=Periconia macrospinosa TaxID=97972 RepID=A0A2V1D1D1_9PLEO|nr:hypothetical protein DM02DRAFT_311846 [Periconia macrospinosa]